jgi:hypothetical protein
MLFMKPAGVAALSAGDIQHHAVLCNKVRPALDPGGRGRCAVQIYGFFHWKLSLSWKGKRNLLK